jgi:hypothetical protein
MYGINSSNGIKDKTMIFVKIIIVFNKDKHNFNQNISSNPAKTVFKKGNLLPVQTA